MRKLRTSSSHISVARALTHTQKSQEKVCVTRVKWLSAWKQQLQYNLMGNKFPFLLSTWPQATNPRAWRVVNFPGKVVNFHKQRPFWCFGRLSHRHFYFCARPEMLKLHSVWNRGRMWSCECFLWAWHCGCWFRRTWFRSSFWLKVCKDFIVFQSRLLSNSVMKTPK